MIKRAFLNGIFTDFISKFENVDQLPEESIKSFPFVIEKLNLL